MSTPAIEPCHRCGGQPDVFHDGSPIEPWVAVCHDCYDGAEDSPTRGDVARGTHEDAAIEEWNETQKDRRYAR